MMNEQALKDRLRSIASERNLSFAACWKQLVLERFLVRLAASGHSHRFIFKGGFLLSYLIAIGRETSDLDFLLTRMQAEEKELQEVFEQILAVYSSDGFAFSFGSIEQLRQPHMDYPGYRIGLITSFAKMRDKIYVDLGVGDVVDPLESTLSLVHYRGKPFFESEVSLLVYPVETIFAEKLETILSKGSSNSRMKDYHDLVLLVRQEGMMKQDKLRQALSATFLNRGTVLRPIQFDEMGLKALQALWGAHLYGLGSNVQHFDLPKEIAAVIEEVNQYVAVVHRFL